MKDLFSVVRDGLKSIVSVGDMCESIVVDGGGIFINGKKVEGVDRSGDIQINVNGNVSGNIQVNAGNVEVHGDVDGDIRVNAGNVDCGDVSGDVHTTCGNVTMKRKG